MITYLMKCPLVFEWMLQYFHCQITYDCTIFIHDRGSERKPRFFLFNGFRCCSGEFLKRLLGGFTDECFN
jgi:hypothetical protein